MEKNGAAITTPQGEQTGKTRSMRTQILLIYILLAVLTIIFFSGVIFVNQTDLLKENFKFKSNELAQNVLQKFQGVAITRQKDDTYNALKAELNSVSVFEFVIADEKGDIWHQTLKDAETPAALEKVKSRIKELIQKNKATVFQKPYTLELQRSKSRIVRTADFLFPSKAKSGTPIYFYSSLKLEQFDELLKKLYFTIAIAVGVGIILQIILGFFVYRIIFRRVGFLKSASDKMAQGDLKARAGWEFKRNDELDELGGAFNGMANRIEETIETITRLNTEIQNELEIGKDVQQLFLPSNKILKEFDVSVYYRPLREVSGDIYNFFDVQERYKCLFFADASGHGVSAALITAITLMSLDDVMRKTIQPHRVIEMLNNSLADRLQSSFFATGVFMVFDKNICYLTNAGHNPPLYIRPATGKLELLEKCGPPLGMFEDVDYRTVKIETRPGDKILIYSDALVESKNKEGEMFGLERATELYTKNIDKPNKEIVNILKTALDEFTFAYNDDVSIILVEMPDYVTQETPEEVPVEVQAENSDTSSEGAAVSATPESGESGETGESDNSGESGGAGEAEYSETSVHSVNQEEASDENKQI